MKSCVATVFLYFPGTDRKILGTEMIPVCPIEKDEDPLKPRRVALEDSHITWYSDSVRQVFKDGRAKTWYYKPTLADAISYTKHCLLIKDGGYFQFRSDGSIVAHCYSENYYWGPMVDAAAVEGTVVEPHECVGGGWDYDDDCQGYCVYMAQQNHCDCECCNGDDDDRWSGVDDDAYGNEGYGGDW